VSGLTKLPHGTSFKFFRPVMDSMLVSMQEEIFCGPGKRRYKLRPYALNTDDISGSEDVMTCSSSAFLLTTFSRLRYIRPVPNLTVHPFLPRLAVLSLEFIIQQPTQPSFNHVLTSERSCSQQSLKAPQRRNRSYSWREGPCIPPIGRYPH
jgi:hypothetical protein